MLELNLLNPTERNKAKKIKAYFIVKHIVFQLITLMIIITSIFYFSTFLLTGNLDSINNQIDDEIQIKTDGNLNSIEDATTQLNTQLQQVNQIQQQYFVWSKFLDNFSKLIPNGITIKELQFNTNILTSATDKTFKIVGNAETREDFIELEEYLNNSEFFTNINAPISNLIEKENINFTITGNISDEVFI